jgi:glucose-6-phosphate-specific signal transduction histidine kinase
MFQELMNNTNKHAQAKNLWTTLEQNDKFTFLKMQDDGIGFYTTGIKWHGTNEYTKPRKIYWRYPKN